jgi:hypothetical protein
MNDQTNMPKLPALAGGGNVMAIVPQTFEETFRIARAVVSAGLAPAALVGKKTGDDAASAVSVAIMSGAELGLKPMVSLRSFTVINGKPALYGDGLINVVRMSGKVKFLNVGFTKNDKRLMRAAGALPSAETEKEFPGSTEEAFKALSEDERTFGFCEAERADTGERKVVIFTMDDAKRAGLYQDKPLVDKMVWENGNKVFKKDQPNDAPWYRFYKRMFGWRAAGYCLRELFGDVLGGIRDEFEAREIAEAEDMRDITPHQPPAPPVPPRPPEMEAEAKPSTVAKVIEHDEPTIEEMAEASEDIVDDTEFFEKLEAELALAGDAETLEEIWDSFDPLARFEGKPQGETNQAIAVAIKNNALKRIRIAS